MSAMRRRLRREIRRLDFEASLRMAFNSLARVGSAVRAWCQDFHQFGGFPRSLTVLLSLMGKSPGLLRASSLNAATRCIFASCLNKSNNRVAGDSAPRCLSNSRSVNVWSSRFSGILESSVLIRGCSFSRSKTVSVEIPDLL